MQTPTHSVSVYISLSLSLAQQRGRDRQGGRERERNKEYVLMHAHGNVWAYMHQAFERHACMCLCVTQENVKVKVCFWNPLSPNVARWGTYMHTHAHTHTDTLTYAHTCTHTHANNHKTTHRHGVGVREKRSVWECNHVYMQASKQKAPTHNVFGRTTVVFKHTTFERTAPFSQVSLFTNHTYMHVVHTFNARILIHLSFQTHRLSVSLSLSFSRTLGIWGVWQLQTRCFSISLFLASLVEVNL